MLVFVRFLQVRKLVKLPHNIFKGTLVFMRKKVKVKIMDLRFQSRIWSYPHHAKLYSYRYLPSEGVVMVFLPINLGKLGYVDKLLAFLPPPSSCEVSIYLSHCPSERKVHCEKELAIVF